MRKVGSRGQGHGFQVDSRTAASGDAPADESEVRVMKMANGGYVEGQIVKLIASGSTATNLIIEF